MNLPNQNTAGAFGERLKETMAHKGIKQVDLINQADTLGFKLGKSMSVEKPFQEKIRCLSWLKF